MQNGNDKYPIISTELVDLKEFVLDAGTQMRPSLNPETVETYTEAAKNAKKAEQPMPFPAIDAFRDPASNAIVLADGFQRHQAHRNAKVTHIMTNIRLGTERDAILFAAGRNAEHGDRRDIATVQKAIVTLATDAEWGKFSNREIAEIVGCSEGTVRNHRPAKATPTVVLSKPDAAGKRREIDTSAIGKPEVAAVKKETQAAEKAEKKAAKKARKPLSTRDGTSKPSKKKPETTVLDENEKSINELERNIGGKEGKGVSKALRDGTLKLSKPEILAWAGMKPSDQKWVMSLVMEKDFKPTAALEFLSGEVPEKLLTEMVLRAMAGGGKVTINQKVNGVGIRVTAEIGKKR